MQDGCKQLYGFLHGIEWIMFHGHLDCFREPPLGGRPNTKSGDQWHSKRSHPFIYSIISCVRIRINRNSLI